MRLEKRPVRRLLSPLPERPIQASNNDCSNTTAYLYIFYQKFEPHSKNKGPPTPHSGESRNPSGFPPAHPSFPRTRESRPRTATNPRTAPPPESPAPPPESPAKAGAHAAPKTTKRPAPPTRHSRPPTRHSRERGNPDLGLHPTPVPPHPPNPPRRRGHTPPPTEPPKAHALGVYARSNSCRLMPRSRRIPWTVPVARSRLACLGTVV